jgi:xylulokinase
MEECVVGLDVGTSGCKVLAISRELEVVGEKPGRYPTYIPRPGWVEQNPDDWWDVARRLLANCALRGMR